ncbi:MAG: CARDB domain-containing protein [Candidatus Bathyarchaeia archaeon]
MNRKKTFTILMIVTIICMSMQINRITALEPTEPHNANAMWIEPSIIELNATTTPLGYKFNVTVWANASKETAGWQFLLYYQRAYLNITRVGYTAGSKSEFFQSITTLPLSPQIPYDENSTHSSLLYGEAWMSGPYRSPGYGSLCWIEFEVIAQPPEGLLVDIPLDIKWTSIVNPSDPDTFLLYSDGSKTPLDIYNGLVRFVGEAPPPPTFTLTITATVGGTTNPAPGTYTYTEGEVASVQALPNAAYRFDHWELNNTDIGDANPVEITMNANYNLHAVFEALPPPTGTRIFVDPPEIIDPTLIPSSTFQINITVDDVLDLKTCIFNLTYNPGIIGWIGMRLYKVQGQFPIPIMIIDDELGYMWMKLNYPTSISTETSIALVGLDFHVDNAGATPLDLQDTQMLNSQGQPMNHSAIDGFFMSQIRDVAVTSVEPSRDWAYQGWTVNINVKVKNKGNVTETFNVATYYNTNLIQTKTVTNLAPNEERTITFTWNTAGVPEGNYTIKAEADAVPYELNLGDNVLINGKVWIITKIRDVAVTAITTDTWAYQGWMVAINVTVENKGNTTETVTLKTYYDATLIEEILVADLAPQESRTLTVNWNTTLITPCHEYTISAEIPQIPYEFNTTNNVYVDGKIKIRVFGDVNGDGSVRVDDIVLAAKAFGSTPNHPRWNPYADLNRDNAVRIDDVVAVAKNFGARC